MAGRGGALLKVMEELPCVLISIASGSKVVGLPREVFSRLCDVVEEGDLIDGCLRDEGPGNGAAFEAEGGGGDE